MITLPNDVYVEFARSISLRDLKEYSLLLDDNLNVDCISWKLGDIETLKAHVCVDTNLSTLEIKIEHSYHLKKDSVVQKFSLHLHPCNYGGHRWYIKCNGRGGKSCEKKMEILYEVDGIFSCRTCAGLTYIASGLSKKERDGFYQVMYAEIYADKHRRKMKRRYYAGKPTRLFKRYLRIIKGREYVYL